jgi:hypothetical protein
LSFDLTKPSIGIWTVTQAVKHKYCVLDEKPFVTKTRPKSDRWIKEFSLRNASVVIVWTHRRLLSGEVRKPSRRLRFSSLISYDVKQQEPEFRSPSEAVAPSGSGGLYGPPNCPSTLFFAPSAVSGVSRVTT